MYTRSVPKEIKNVLRSVAERCDVDYRLVEDIYYHEFEFIAKMMEIGSKGEYSSFENILLKEFGSFIANEKHINKLKEIQDAKQTDLGEISI